MSDRPETATGRIIRGLLARHGITRYALFLTQGGGKRLPGGVESLSGFVLASSGEIHGFWLDWDVNARGYVLDPWYRVEDPCEFASSPEYLQALKRLGIENH